VGSALQKRDAADGAEWVIGVVVMLVAGGVFAHPAGWAEVAVI